MMKDIEIIYNIVKTIVKDTSFASETEIPPVFSFEGLPGAGKTTQIIKTSEALEKKYGKSYYIDLPTNSSVGLVLKAMYSDQKNWNKLTEEAPWLNPLLLSVDLQLAIQEAKKSDAKYILMSRGILSTYYYNYDAYINKYKTFDVAWDELNKVLKGFIRPTAIIFFEISAEEAHKRVVKRNRGTLRKMDQIENMRKDRLQFNTYIDKIKQEIPIYYIDASSDVKSVTNRIDKILFNYLKETNYD